MPHVRARARRAVEACRVHISVSESVKRSVERHVGKRLNLIVIPNGVNGSLFTLPPDGFHRKPGQIIFAGAVRPVKGVDILLQALRILTAKGRATNLIVVGEAFYGKYREEEARLRQMVSTLGLDSRVSFIGKQLPAELARSIQQSSLLVLPSRMESFGMVLVEALACGTPVVSTRSGGPEDIVNDKVGVLAPVEDPEAMANAIEYVLDHQSRYDPALLRSYALEKFGLEAIGPRMDDIYGRAIAEFRTAGLTQPERLAGGSVAT
jgi:glycosyltransferase involved in cell wall biosynthesis